MFFTISKIFGFLLMPLNIVFLLLLAGFLLIAFKRAIGRSFQIMGMVLFILFGLLPLGHNGLVYLENIYDRPETMPERVDGILILGGASETALSTQRDAVILNDSAERIIDGLALGQKYPSALLVFSGGNGALLKSHTTTEADVTRSLIAALSYENDNIFYEDESRTTFENIKFSRELFFPQREETWLLVTSAYHMPRAMAVAQRQNWINFVPYPTDFRTSGEYALVPSRLNVLGEMAKLQLAIHEYAGLAGYQLAGRISLPLH